MSSGKSAEPGPETWCNDCRPKMINFATREPLPPEAPEMRIVTAIWEATTPEERAALHRVTCDRSSDPADCATAQALWERMRVALMESGES